MVRREGFEIVHQFDTKSDTDKLNNNMDKENLNKLVEDGLSTYQIAKEMNCSQTNVRHWLRKYGMNTNNLSKSKDKKDCKNGHTCISCGTDLTGFKWKFCSRECKGKNHNPNTYTSQKKRAKERKIKIIEMSGGKCYKCGYSKNIAALCFHHRNPEDKTFSIESRKLSNTNWNSILLEWKKCDLLCANCHMEEHYPEANIK